MVTETKKNKDLSKANLKELQIKNASIVVEVANLNTASGMEERIRENLGAGKEGEGLIIITDQIIGSSTSDSSNASFWMKIKSLFGK